MNSINKTNFTSMNGLSDIYSDDIISNNLTSDSVNTNTLVLSGNDLTSTLNSIATYETDTNTTLSNIQSQLNNITSTSSSGGGYFTVVCERLGHNINNTFGFGAGQYNNNEIILPACTLKRSYITASQSLASGTTNFNIFKNNVSTSESVVMSTPSSSNTNTHNITFAEGDTFKIKTLNGGTYTSNSSVQIRINLIFECVGIKGADGISPTLTIGTVSTLPSSSDASVTNSGTSTNQILNFSIPQGVQGIQGMTPNFSIGNVSNLASNDLPFVNFDTLSTATNKIFNFGLVQGVTPTFSIGSVVNLAENSIPYVNFDTTSTLTNKIFNFGLVQGVTPTFSIGSVVNLTENSIPYVNFDSSSTLTNKIFNFGLVQGVTPTFSVGSVVNLPNGSTPYVNFDSSSTLTNKILNFGIVRGSDGTNGTNGTNGIDAGDIGNAIGTSAVFLILQGQVTVLQGQMATVQGQILAIDGTLGTHTTEIATLTEQVGTHDQILSGIETKLYNVVKTPDALQVKSKFQIINNVGGLVGSFVLATFDPIGNTITLGTTSTTNNMVGDTINIGSLTTATNNVRGSTLNIGNIVGGTQTTTTNIRGSTINNGSTDTTTNNMKGSTINIGDNNFSDTINVEAPHINIGTALNTTIDMGSQNTTTNMKGNTINIGQHNFSDTINVDATNINIGTALASVDITDSTVDITGSTIDIAQNSAATVNIGTFDTDVNIEGETVNIGYHSFGSTNVINMQGSTINIGTVGVASTVNIGNVLSNVFIESMDNTAIKVGNFFSQF